MLFALSAVSETSLRIASLELLPAENISATIFVLDENKDAVDCETVSANEQGEALLESDASSTQAAMNTSAGTTSPAFRANPPPDDATPSINSHARKCRRHLHGERFVVFERMCELYGRTNGNNTQIDQNTRQESA